MRSDFNLCAQYSYREYQESTGYKGCRASNKPDCPPGTRARTSTGTNAQAAEKILGLSGKVRRLIQERLAAAGFNPGIADGIFGSRTRDAIRGWQESQNEPATGFLTASQADSLAGGVSQQAATVPAAQTAQQAQQTAVVAARDLSPKCPVKGSYCWIEVPDKPGCFIWTWYGKDAPKWSGGCKGGFASGKGRVTSGYHVDEGSLVEGVGLKLMHQAAR